jgi:hypothetical protein
MTMMISMVCTFLQPLAHMNPRLSIGGSALSVVVAGGLAIALIRPLV